MCNNFATFKIGERLGSGALSYATIQGQLGSEAETENGKVWRLYQLNEAAGNAAPGSKVFQVVSSALYTVKTGVTIGTTSAHRIVGVAHPDQVDLTQGDLFWLQVAGRCEVISSNDGDTIDAGDYLRVSGDTDLGKVRTAVSADTTYLADVTCLIAVDSPAAVDSVTFTADIIRKLLP